MVEIIIKIIGTAGALDLPEGEYAVRNLIDTAERTREIMLNEGKKWPNYGWSVISAKKVCICPTTHRITSTHVKGCPFEPTTKKI